MSQILHRKVVLVLNRNWQAIDVTSPAIAFSQLFSDSVTALDVRGESEMIPCRWEEWAKLPIRKTDRTIGTPHGMIRVPTVVVLARFDRVPLKRPKFGRRGIWERDEGRCQYTGRPLRPGEGNIDHVVPRSRGGASSWENCVLSDRRVNERKGNRTPQEAGLRLLKEPKAPRPAPVTAFLRNEEGIAEWEPFLVKN